PVVVEVGVVDARLERAAGDALQAGAAEPLDEVALAHAGARLLVGDARVDLTRSAPEVRDHLQPAAGDVPHCGGDGAAGLRHARHLPDALVGVAHTGGGQRAHRRLAGAVVAGQRRGDALALLRA